MSYYQPAKHDDSAQHFEDQTRKIVTVTFNVLLADVAGSISNISLGWERESAKDVVCEAMIAACKRILEMHRQELRAELNQLDVSQSAVCTSYHQFAKGLFEGGCNWGKLVMFITASSIIAARMYFERHIEFLLIIEEWLIDFILKSHCKDWITQHDGWDRFPDTFSPYKQRTDVATSSRVAKHDDSAQHFEDQTRKIVTVTFNVLLADVAGSISNISLGWERDSAKDVVCEAMIAACKRILEMHRQELRTELNQLDVSQSAVCTSYHQFAKGLFEGGCNWGKLVMLITASSIIAARMYFERHIEFLLIIEEWLIDFILKSHCKDWITQHDGWDRFPDTFSPYKQRTDVAASSRVAIANRSKRPSAEVPELLIIGSINNPMCRSNSM